MGLYHRRETLMSLISSCPKCQKHVTIPEGAAADALVRCPLCHVEFDLGEALALIPPALIVVIAKSTNEAGETVLAPPADEVGLFAFADEHELAAEHESLRQPVEFFEDNGEEIATADEEEDAAVFGAITGKLPSAEEGAAAKRLPPKLPGVAASDEVDEAGEPVKKKKRRRPRQPHPVRVGIGMMMSGLLAVVVGYYGLNFFGGEQYDIWPIYLPGVPHTYKHWPGKTPMAQNKAGAAKTQATGNTPTPPKAPAASPPAIPRGTAAVIPATAPLPKADKKPEAKLESKPAANPADQAVTKPDRSPLAMVDSKPAAKPETRLKPDSDLPSDPDMSGSSDSVAQPDFAPAGNVPAAPDLKPVGTGAKPEAQPEAKPEEKPDAKREEQPDKKPAAKADVKPESKPEAKPEEKSAPKPEVKPEVKPEPKPEPKPEVKPDVKPAPKPEAKPDVKPEAKPDDKSDDLQPKTEVKNVALPADYVGPRNPPSYDVAAADKTFKAVQGSFSADVTPEVYERIRRLGEVLTFLNADQAKLAEQKQAVQTLLSKAASQPAQMDKIAQWANELLAAGADVKGGIFFTGTVTGVGVQGALHGAAVRLPGQPKPVSVMSSQAISIAKNDRVLVLGSIVREPAKNLVGYKGSQAVIIWAALAIKLPEAK